MVVEGGVVADVHRLGDVRGDEILVGRIHAVFAGRERDDEVSTGKQSVQPALLGEPGSDLSGGVRGDLKRRLDVVDRDDLMARGGES